ncbi:hypothetical protein NDU88_007368 [Pleurodeles waltl]|uniref:Uncharacterized protein n=1 Tax=Pleurodeles waltl TaxID=8319 RepID=A0AAV7PL33_PLEWA|nr:hypothetical protein NDU88_007368 [Pleurodeles waltl]
MRPTSSGRDQRRDSGGVVWPGVCPGWRLPGRETGGLWSSIAGRARKEELLASAIAAVGGAETDRGAWIPEMRLEAGEAVSRGAVKPRPGQLGSFE